MPCTIRGEGDFFFIKSQTGGFWVQPTPLFPCHSSRKDKWRRDTPKPIFLCFPFFKTYSFRFSFFSGFNFDKNIFVLFSDSLTLNHTSCFCFCVAVLRGPFCMYPSPPPRHRSSPPRCRPLRPTRPLHPHPPNPNPPCRTSRPRGTSASATSRCC